MLNMTLTQTQRARTTRSNVSSVMIFCGLILLTGCATANTGSLKHSRDVAQAFETYHVFDGHRYYYLNQENAPYAIVALQNRYTFSDRLWTEFDPRSKKLEKLVGLVKTFPVNNAYAYGSYLNDPRGNQIGYWYSSLPPAGITVDEATMRVSISTDTPWLRDNDRGFGSRIGIGIGSGGSGIGIQF